jgi:hypothetical protein
MLAVALTENAGLAQAFMVTESGFDETSCGVGRMAPAIVFPVIFLIAFPFGIVRLIDKESISNYGHSIESQITRS